MDALPPETKDPVKQNAGRQTRKNRKESAARPAAPVAKAIKTEEEVVAIPQDNGMAVLLQASDNESAGEPETREPEASKEDPGGDDEVGTSNISKAGEGKSSNIICKVYNNKFAIVFAALKNSKEATHLEFNRDLVLVTAWADSGSPKGEEL